MSDFVQQRHQAFSPLEQPRELVVACVPLRSNVNLSRIVRAAGCCGITRVIYCGQARVIEKIARDAVDDGREDSDQPMGVQLEVHRTLLHPLLELKRQGYRLIGLEQTSDSKSLLQYAFPRRAVLVVGNERRGIEPDILAALDDVVEIPVWGPPH